MHGVRTQNLGYVGLRVMAWVQMKARKHLFPLDQRVAIHLSLLHLLASLPISILSLSPISVFCHPSSQPVSTQILSRFLRR